MAFLITNKLENRETWSIVNKTRQLTRKILLLIPEALKYLQKLFEFLNCRYSLTKPWFDSSFDLAQNLAIADQCGSLFSIFSFYKNKDWKIQSYLFPD